MRKYSGAMNANEPVADYVEGTVFSKDQAVVMVGSFCDVPHNEKHKVSITLDQLDFCCEIDAVFQQCKLSRKLFVLSV